MNQCIFFFKAVLIERLNQKIIYKNKISKFLKTYCLTNKYSFFKYTTNNSNNDF